MIQVLALRPYRAQDGTIKISEKWFDKGIRVGSVDELINDPKTVLEGIDISERWNVYYTVSECLEEPGRKFLSQSVIPFDIDGLDLGTSIDINKFTPESAARLACDALGVAYEEVGVVFSGNGVQILIQIKEPFTDPGYFDEARLHYRALCEKINLKLSAHKVAGKADPSVWSPARLLRHPATYNRKQNKPERLSYVIQGTMLPQDFSLEKASGIPKVQAGDHLNADVVRQLFTGDPDAILDSKNGCDFLKFARSSPEKISEALWYAMLSITERFPDPSKWSHELSKGHPKYSFQETDMKRKQAVAASGPRTCKNIQGLGFNCEMCPQFGKVHSPISIEGPNSIKTLNTGFYFQKLSKEGVVTKGAPDYQGLHRFFRRTHDYVSVKESPEMYIFDETHWKPIGRDDVLSFAHENFKPAPMDRERKEFYSFVKVSNQVGNDFFECQTPGTFNFKNGVFRLDSKKLEPHDKQFGFRHVLPVAFDETAKAPRFEQFMKEVSCNRPQIEMLLQEFMGYVISGMPCSFEKGLLLLGSGANGKSTFVNVLRLLAGSASSSLSARDIVDPAKRAAMNGKIVNIAEENSLGSFRDVETLKNMISGGMVWAKILYSQPFEFRNKAKMIFLCNTLPTNYDSTHGFFRKLTIAPFDAVFDGAAADIGLNTKLESELAGIFNYAVIGYQRLMENKGFTNPEESQEILGDYAATSDHVSGWLSEEVDIINSEEVRTLKESLYINYQDWCARSGIRYPDNKQRFFFDLKHRIERMGVKWKEIRGREGSDRQRFVCKLQLKGPNAMLVDLTKRDAGLYTKKD